MKKAIFVLLGATIYHFVIFAQGEIDAQQRVFYRNEWSVAFMLNSNGFGGNYRYGQHVDAANKRLYEVDLVYLKDPKEYKSYTYNPGSNTRYVDGKKNLAVNFRIGYGKQHEQFRKHDAGGIAIRYFYNFGPSVALLKPIYYEIVKSQFGERGNILPPDKYNSQWTAKNIYIMGRASFFKGFDEISFVPGVFGKFGYNFEFSTNDRIVHALEVGAIAEGFIKKIEIMDFTNPYIRQTDVAKNRQLFLTLFISYRFGRIVDPYEVKKKRERSTEISY